MEIFGTRGQILMAKCTKIDFGWGSAPDPAGGSLRRSPRPPSQMRRGIPLSHTLPPRRLWRSSLRRLAPRFSRLRRSAASQRLKPTLLLPSGAATGRSLTIHSAYCYWGCGQATGCPTYRLCLAVLVFWHKMSTFYRAMLCNRGTSHGPMSVRPSVRLSVRQSQVCVLLKRLNVGSHKQHHTIVQGL